MRIIYVLTSLGVGGAERQVIGLAERMAARGHRVLLVVLKGQAGEEWPSGIEKIYLKIRKNPVDIFGGVLRARRTLDEYKPEVVHSHTFPANMFARVLKIISKPFLLVGTIHNVYEGGWWRMLAYRWTDGLSERTTAVSEAAAERFVRLKAVPQSKVMVLTNGIEVEEFDPEKIERGGLRRELGTEEEFVWLAVGRVTAAKDYENLLRGFALVKAKRNEARLWIAGEESEEGERLRGLAAEIGVSEAVSWLGLRRDVAALMRNADGFVLSSAWEGMPLVIGEAMACGLPLVATDVGGVREIAGECGVIVPAKNAEKLARGMSAVMEMSAERRGELGAKARARVLSEFEMDGKAEVWERFYERELKGFGEGGEKVSALKFGWPILVAGALRLGLMIAVLMRTGTGVITSGDMQSYLLPGMNLVRHGRFWNALGAEIDRTPGYAIFLGIFGEHGLVAAVVAQIFVEMLSVWLVIRIAKGVYKRSEFRDQIALMAGWIFAVEPLSLIFTVRLLPETVFVFFLLLTVDGLVRFFDTEKLAAVAWSALWMVVATYVRPVGYYLIPLLAIGLAAVLMRRPKLRWKAPLVVMAIAVPLLGVWQVRNFVETGFGGFSTVAAKNLYFYQAAGVVASVEGRSLGEVQSEVGYADADAYLRLHPEQRGWSDGQRVDYERREAMRVLSEQPAEAVRLQLKGAAVVALTPGAADFLRMIGEYPEDAPERVVGKNLVVEFAGLLRKHFGVAMVMVIFELILLGIYLFAVAGCWGSSIGSLNKTLLWGLILYFVLVSGGVQAVGRYRMPVMPVFCLLAAGGVVRVRNRLGTKRAES